MEEILENQEELHELLKIRRDKLDELKNAGKDPYAITKFDVSTDSESIKKDFAALEAEKGDEIGEGFTVTIAGRVMSRRIMGKASFIDVQDGAGRIQSYVKRDDVGEDVYAEFKKWDIGDIIGITGFVFRTRMGYLAMRSG